MTFTETVRAFESAMMAANVKAAFTRHLGRRVTRGDMKAILAEVRVEIVRYLTEYRTGWSKNDAQRVAERAVIAKLRWSETSTMAISPSWTFTEAGDDETGTWEIAEQ
jgi:hypothetical protein